MQLRKFIPILAIASVAAVVVLYFRFRQPTQWEHIEMGMTQEDLEKIVPNFHRSWDAFGIATEDLDRWGFRWRLTIHKEDQRVNRIRKELLLDGPKPLTLWIYDAIGPSQAKELKCIFAAAPSTSQAEQGGGGNSAALRASP